MSLRRLSAVLLATTLSAGQAPLPQQDSARAKETQATQVTAVVVDVVVRDGDGQPVLDLRADEFEVFEDGVRQEPGSFTPIHASPVPADTATTPSGTTAQPLPQAGQAPELMAFVFDRLSPEAQGLATKAAMTYVGKAPLTTNVIAVFGVDLSLVLYQPFTRETALVRRALDTIQHRSSVQYGSTWQQQSAAAEQARRSAAQVTAATSSPGGAGQAAPDVAAAASAAQFARMQSRSLERFESLERDQQGYATSNALLAIVSAMKPIAGRKSVIFFSEGLSIPANVQQQFVSVIDAANRANVSIYPMDAAGLRTTNPLTYTREGVEAASAATLARNPTRDVSDRPMTEALERNEDLLRADPQSGLGTLADQTGGFLIANSNDLRSGFARVDSDLRNYYVITYVPQNARMDGRFRSIDVRVKRRGVRVSSRKGYYAVRPPITGAPVLPYEAPALAALEQTPLPNALPVRATALQFPEAARLGLLPVLVRVPLDAVAFQRSPDGRTYTADVAVIVQFKDATGQVLDKVSQRYQLSGPVAAKDRTGRGEILFYREPVLDAGTHTMETVVRDALADKTSVRIQTVTIPAVDATALRMSTVVAVARSEKVPSAERVPGSPLYVGDQLLYPGFGEPFSKTAYKALPFYFVAYTRPGAGDASAVIELLHDGQRVAQTPLELAPADDTGRIEQVSRLPLDPLVPGRYELRVQVTQGGRTVARSMPFRVES
jgi:VWFA-related protein